MKLTQKILLTTATALFMVGCSQPANDKKTEAGSKPASTSNAHGVVIYSNADEEAVTAIQGALDKAGYKGKYTLQSFGTSELGGKLLAEGKNIEADLVTMSSFYLESAQAKNSMFKQLGFTLKPVVATPNYYTPLIGITGSILLNTKEMANQKLPKPTSVKDLANPIYKDKIAIVDPKGSSTGWLLVQDVVSSYGTSAEGQKIMNAIRDNAGANLETSGSGPIKKVLAGEVPIGFGLRHQAIVRKAEGLPIDYVDPAEGNFILTESVAVIDKGDKTNPDAMKMAEVIATQARPEILKVYPSVLYQGETVNAQNQLNNIKTFDKPLTSELLKQHTAFFHGTPMTDAK